MDSARRRRRFWTLVALAIVVIGGCIALVLWQDPPATLAAGVAVALCVLLLSGITEPFLLMIGGNGLPPRDEAEPVEVGPSMGLRPEPGAWDIEAVFQELARLVEAEGGSLEVLRSGERISVVRRDASPEVACELAVSGPDMLEHRELGDQHAPRDDIHELLDRLAAATGWQIVGVRI